jgi:exodeoxyribonuclease VII large subunit
MTATVSSDRNESVFSVSELNRLARMALEKGLPSCRVRGEISNFSSATSRHWYFTLKDDQAGVRCVMFRTRNQFVDWTPRDGDQVELRVQPTLYEQRGDYQLLVDAMRKAGQGSLFEAYLRLKNKLETEGLLSLARKRTIPQFPRSIGIITSPQAAALRDVLSTITARWPGCGVILYPTPVQGDSAARGLIEAISTAGLRRECDVLLLVRGGGSLEDLLGFNDESVARAIVACPIPIVSGVGHETDFTIADFVADLRAPTPTGAAQLATPSRIDIRLHIQHLNTRLYQIQQSKFHALSQQLDGLRRRVTHPRDRIAFRRQQIRHLTWRLNIAMKAGVDSGASRLARCKRVSVTIARDSQSYRERVISHERRLHAAMHKLIEDRGQSVRVFLSHLELLSPSSVLRRGYSIVLNERREVLRDAAEVVIGQHLEIRLAQGALGAEVVRIEDSNN